MSPWVCKKSSACDSVRIKAHLVSGDASFCRAVSVRWEEAYVDNIELFVWESVKEGLPERILNSMLEERQAVLVLGTDLPGVDCVNVLERLNSEGLSENVIIVSWYYSYLQKRLLSDAGVGYCFCMPLDEDLLLKRIADLGRMLSEKTVPAEDRMFFENKAFFVRDSDLMKRRTVYGNDDVYTRTTKLLHDIGVPANLCGHEYLREAVVMAAGQGELYGKVTKMIYPAIGKKYSKSSASVEKAIRTALETAWLRGQVDLLNEIFGFTVSMQKGKPTNSEFIALLADYVTSCG
jgi:two-component system response regulator (stage 0 sporulation protein A)